VQADLLPSNGKGGTFTRWLPRREPTCPIKTSPVSMPVADAGATRDLPGVTLAKWLREGVERGTAWAADSSKEWFSARRSPVRDRGLKVARSMMNVPAAARLVKVDGSEEAIGHSELTTRILASMNLALAASDEAPRERGLRCEDVKGEVGYCEVPSASMHFTL